MGRLRAIVRLREAVATSTEPQLQRGQDDDLRERDYSTEQRVEMAKRGQAMPVRNAKGEIVGGRYPIETPQDVRNAVSDAGRTSAGSEEHAHIIRNAARVGAINEIPGDWRPKPAGQASKSKAKPKRKRESAGKTKPAKATQFRAVLREAAITKAGTAFECTVIAEGPGNPKDANAYSREALRKAVEAGLFEGLQCYANHATASEERERPERDVRQLVGHFQEARFVDGQRAEVRAKFVPIQGPGYEWITTLIESALSSPKGRPLIGISIDGYGHAPDQKEIGGRTYNLVREITELGSADIVTRAGAGGQFHRRLSESLAGARASASSDVELTAAKLQKRVRRALARLEKGLAAENDGKVREAFVALHEAASASVRAPVPRAEGRSSDSTKLQRQVRQERKQRREAEARADTLGRAALAGRLLREVDVPRDTKRLWFDELVEQPDEKDMRKVLERRVSERRDALAELSESLGLNRIEGNPQRLPSQPYRAAAGEDLLGRMGIDRSDLEAA